MSLSLFILAYAISAKQRLFFCRAEKNLRWNGGSLPGCINQDKFNQLKEIAEETARIIGGLRAAVQKQRDNKK
ncbi:MAG: hypothetical protein L6365_17470 [Desulfobulbaceae bacterium]|nr:hypothetical protein [Desulfobulbaceae bacterium]